MEEIFADLHVHIGRSENGKPIKITAARSLNFANIARECADRKGINVVGIIDCASPYVIEDIENFLKTGEAYEIEDGGIIYKDKVCILLGSEVETSEVGRNGKCGAAHNICFFPHLKDIKAFSQEMSHHIKNITLSTQRSNISGYELIDIVEKYNGILIPAHCFTPFKSYYGNCTDRMKDIFKEKFDKIFAIELGLSADTYLADMISELEGRTFVTDSDAHSLPKIAREYNKMLVKDISFKIHKGESLGIIGSTGCGKTTLINLLMRFYDVNSGTISVDGTSIMNMTRHSLRQNIGMVLQDTWLKAGTIRDNIVMGKPDATDEEVIAAAKASHADSFIKRLPDGYNTWITEDGGSLSQGQKQLLCITRVMLCLPPMLILDEATSSIDTRTELKIQHAFAQMMQGRTSFIVAHRLSTVREADIILVMKDGKIIEQGRHEELLANGGFYATLYNSQFVQVKQS